MCWVIRTGAPWHDLPPDAGDGCAALRRFSRWRKQGVWAELRAALIDEPDWAGLLIDASQIKVHQHGTGAVGGNPAGGRAKGAEYETALGGGWARDAGATTGPGRHGGRLHPGGGTD